MKHFSDISSCQEKTKRHCVKTIFVLTGALLTLGLTACGSKEEKQTQTAQGIQTEQDTQAESKNNTTAEHSETSDAENARILIAYFSIPEDVDPSGVDAVSGASIVVRDGEVYGNTEYVAKIVQEMAGGDLFRIEAIEDYPLDHDPLVDQAADEQDENARPELKNHIQNLEQYDTIILGFPNWWADLPMPVYTFLEEYDFSGKTIIPFVTHGGSGFSNTRDTISELQPNAVLSGRTLSLSREDVADSEAEIRQWAESGI